VFNERQFSEKLIKMTFCDRGNVKKRWARVFVLSSVILSGKFS